MPLCLASVVTICDLAGARFTTEKNSQLTNKQRLSPSLTALERRREAGDRLAAVMSEQNVNTLTGRIRDFDRCNTAAKPVITEC